MSRKLTCAEAFVLSLAAAWSTVGCMTTAFGIAVTAQREIGIGWTVCSIICIAMFSNRRGGWLLLGLDLLAGWALWHWKLIQEPLFGLLNTFAETYDSAYGLGIPEILRGVQGKPDLALGLLGVLVIECVCHGICSRKGTALAAAALVLPLAACLVVTDTVPGKISLFVLLLCLVLLLVTDNVRAESGGQGTKLAMIAVIPIALALGFLFFRYPQETYVNQTEQYRERLIAYMQEVPEKLQQGQAAISSFARPREQVDLAALSAQPQLGLPVAEVAVEQSGTVYLRVRDYDRYTGTAWESTPDRQETLVGTGDSRGTVVVRELSTQGGMLLPSYPNGDMVLDGGVVSGQSGETVYQVECLTAAMGARPGEEWLTLPEESKTRVRGILESIPGDRSNTNATAAAIANYVRRTAAYDRRPGVMPTDRDEFTVWFLEEADRGYCVHFATAAAVLLRSAGIPARYVTGYKADAVAGVTTRVTSNDAHAWVEYYNYDTWSWSILEATPGILETVPTEMPTEETQLPTEQVQTQPTTPTEITRPAVSDPVTPANKPRQIPVGLLLGIGIAIMLAGTVELQRVLRIRFRRRRQSRGDTNRRALERWRELETLTRLVGRKMPETLRGLAEKALFSQHTLAPEELKLFAAYAAQCRRKLRGEKWWKRILYRYWYAVL